MLLLTHWWKNSTPLPIGVKNCEFIFWKLSEHLPIFNWHFEEYHSLGYLCVGCCVNPCESLVWGSIFGEFQQAFLILTIASFELARSGREPLGDGRGIKRNSVWIWKRINFFLIPSNFGCEACIQNFVGFPRGIPSKRWVPNIFVSSLGGGTWETHKIWLISAHAFIQRQITSRVEFNNYGQKFLSFFHGARTFPSAIAHTKLVWKYFM
jgi:hypothetical protein